MTLPFTIQAPDERNMEVTLPAALCPADVPSLWRLAPIYCAEARRTLLRVRRRFAPAEVPHRYAIALCAKAVQTPDLACAALQKRYGVIGAEALLEAMLPPAALDVLLVACRALLAMDNAAA